MWGLKLLGPPAWLIHLTGQVHQTRSASHKVSEQRPPFSCAFRIITAAFISSVPLESHSTSVYLIFLICKQQKIVVVAS